MVILTFGPVNGIRLEVAALVLELFSSKNILLKILGVFGTKLGPILQFKVTLKFDGNPVFCVTGTIAVAEVDDVLLTLIGTTILWNVEARLGALVIVVYKLLIATEGLSPGNCGDSPV